MTAKMRQLEVSYDIAYIVMWAEIDTWGLFTRAFYSRSAEAGSIP